MKSSQDWRQVFDAMEVSSLLGKECAFIPMPIPTRNGALALRHDDRAYALLPYVDAEKHHGPSLSEPKLRAAAHTLAEFHEYAVVAENLASPQIPLSSRVSHFFCNVERVRREALSSSYPNTEVVLSSLKAKELLVEGFTSVNDPVMETGCNSVIHGDFHNENILFRNDDIVAILDFENFRQGDAQQDLVSFVHLACCNSGFSEENLHKAEKFVGAYVAKRPDININIEVALSYYILCRICTVALEENYLNDGNEGIWDILQRDMAHMTYLIGNIKYVASKIQGNP